MKKYIKNFGTATSQWFNAVVFLGDPDETISSRLGKSKHPVAMVFCKILDVVFLDPDHCKNSVEQDEGKDSLV